MAYGFFENLGESFFFLIICLSIISMPQVLVGTRFLLFNFYTYKFVHFPLLEIQESLILKCFSP